MKILISIGSIPAKLDSVKYIGNRFRGGLALKTAQGLFDRGFEDISIVKWRHNPIEVPLNFEVYEVDDIMDYYRFVLDPTRPPYDAYILAGAIANLMPQKAWTGKFPSHDYVEGDVINIPFTIAPRIIDRIKKFAPRSTLIGYKLSDCPPEELIRATKEVLHGSRANIVFANSPQWAKERKLAVMPDNSVIPCTFDDHIDLMARMLRAIWFRTEIIDAEYEIDPLDQEIIDSYPRTQDGDHTFGTFAIRKGNGFLTTTRGKRGKGVCYVREVDFRRRVVWATEKATLNAPMLEALLRTEGGAVVLHDHKTLPGAFVAPYRFPGTTGDIGGIARFNIKHHGYVISHETREEALRWIREESP